MQRPSGLPQARSKARGNITYIEFLKMVNYLWDQSHPDVPMYHANSPVFTSDVVDNSIFNTAIVHKLEVRKSHASEPKPRIREEAFIDGQAYRVEAQRFVDIITFTVVDKDDPFRADMAIETFEEFMLENTPVFKEMGVSEFFYSRRMPDNDVKDHGQDFLTRTVAYQMTEERIRLIPQGTLDEIIIDLRLFLMNNRVDMTPDDGATPIVANLVDTHSATPSWY